MGDVIHVDMAVSECTPASIPELDLATEQMHHKAQVVG
jgi:hypothetical protein